ncbi:MAG: SpoIIE family protein phosphatase [Halieaceae bacterium]|nr:SpoIIE family protein phosphatase [Halieaceae bacterium]
MTDIVANIILIDDDSARAAASVELLQSLGHSVRVIQDPFGFNESLDYGSEVDLLVCETELTQFSWEEAKDAILALDIHVPAIMLADEAEAQVILTALRLGVSDFFVRPIRNLNALDASIERCVKRRRIRQELSDSKRALELINTELRDAVTVLEQDQQAGRQVQLRMLPNSPLAVNGYEFRHSMYPSLFLSGDFVEYITVGDDHVVFFMADVSGHGSSSAFATVLLKNLFARKRSDFIRRNDHTLLDLGAMLEYANKELLDLAVGKYATMIVGLLNIKNNTLDYSVAGHLPQPILKTSLGADYLDGEGAPVGLMEHARYVVYQVKLPSQFMLVMFSDGVLELIEGEDLIAKESKLKSIIDGSASNYQAVLEDLGVAQAREIPDDIAALFITRAATNA